MNINQQAALTLSKSNLSLLLTLCELGRSQSAQMINELEAQLESCDTEFHLATKALLQANDWNAACWAVINLPLLVSRLQIHQLQKIFEASVAAQLRVTAVSREAMASWQRETALALQETAGAMPLSTALRGLFGAEATDLKSWTLEPPVGAYLPVQHGSTPHQST
ncbi:MAG: hypothetical protein EBR85_01610 [Betaproteobacteria bacterium]|nr:hypothetical protein [Betaproteobacteria bacterium]